MRITEEEREQIKKTIRSHIKECQIYLFGSRVNDKERGGDIDLLVIPQNQEDTSLDIKIKILSELNLCLGEQKIDLLLSKDLGNPFVKIAISQGIEL